MSGTIKRQTILFVGIAGGEGLSLGNILRWHADTASSSESRQGANQMFNTQTTRTHEFKEGDNVVLAEGTYQGTLGVFIRLRQDVNWAEIRERDGVVRCHPVVWLQHADPAGSTVS